MCFSANASFTAAGALSVVGLLSMRATTNNKKLMPLAAMPLLFALQQACEGFVWITLNNGDSTSYLVTISTYGFIFFASAWWPVWMPLSLYIAEKTPLRKKALLLTIILGTCSGIALFYSWTFYTTGARIIKHHIDYPVPNYPFDITNPFIAQIVSLLISITYCIATLAPFFISSLKYIWTLGIALIIGFFTSYFFYCIAFSSVWCFFAAISSIVLYWIIKKQAIKV